jgi:hypothetical protein
MSTGVNCQGKQFGLSGERCDGLAPAETGVCRGCCSEARGAGKTIQRIAVLDQLVRAWSADRELEA